MKLKLFVVFLIVLTCIAFYGLYMMPKSLNSQLDNLETIIDKYEPEFDNVVYGTQEYTDITNKYNHEIFSWAQIFENDRYKRDADGRILYDSSHSPILNPDFKNVEKRFYELNNRMTKMVLKSIPKEKPNTHVDER